MTLDQRIYLFLFGGEAVTTLTRVMIALSWIGSGYLMVVLVPLAIAVRTRRFALTLGATLAAQGALVFALKHAFGRTRPFVLLHTHPAIAAPSDPSFPSGHATGAFAAAAFIATWCLMTPTLRVRYAIAACAVAVAAGIAASRVYLGVHYPGDVLGGALLGGALGATAARWHVGRRASPHTMAHDHGPT